MGQNSPSSKIIYVLEGFCPYTEVAIYISDDLKYKERPDLDIFVEGGFETVFVEILSESHSCIIGEIIRIPNTNEIISIDRFENILQSLQVSNKDIIIATDQNFDYLKYMNTKTQVIYLMHFWTLICYQP